MSEAPFLDLSGFAPLLPRDAADPVGGHAASVAGAALAGSTADDA